MPDRRSVDDLSIEELERLLVVRRREERLRRLRDKSLPKKPQDIQDPPKPPADVKRHDELAFLERVSGRRNIRTRSSSTTEQSWRDRLLLFVEILALGGLVIAVVLFLFDRPALLGESEAAAGDATPPAGAEVAGGGTAQQEVLPGRPPPPPESAHAALPALYAGWLDTTSQQAGAVTPDETEMQQRPVRVVIPSIDVDASIVPGDDWEALKKGVGHHLGSALPGERGNLVLSAHNDIFGEIFRYLNEVETGDEVLIYDGAGRRYRYVVAVKRIVEPTAVEVLESTNEPVATLITCHPYLVDTERLVVVAELQQ